MGWTKGREVQCGCGWEGSNLEVVRHHIVIQKPIFRTPQGDIEMAPVIMDTRFLCPECRADVTRQATLTEFQIAFHDGIEQYPPEGFEKYQGKALRSDWYRTIGLNDD